MFPLPFAVKNGSINYLYYELKLRVQATLIERLIDPLRNHNVNIRTCVVCSIANIFLTFLSDFLINT